MPCRETKTFVLKQETGHKMAAAVTKLNMCLFQQISTRPECVGSNAASHHSQKITRSSLDLCLFLICGQAKTLHNMSEWFPWTDALPSVFANAPSFPLSQHLATSNAISMEMWYENSCYYYMRRSKMLGTRCGSVFFMCLSIWGNRCTSNFNGKQYKYSMNKLLLLLMTWIPSRILLWSCLLTHFNYKFVENSVIYSSVSLVWRMRQEVFMFLKRS